MARRFNAKQVAFNSLRRAFSRTKLANDARAKALSHKKGIRGGRRYICAKCGKDFGIKEINVDHVDPVIDVRLSVESMSLRMIFDRTFCDPSNLQIICTSCHKEKSKEENAERKIWRKKKKYVVTRVTEGSQIKVISIVDLKTFPLDTMTIISVHSLRKDADADCKRRKKLKG